MILLIKTIKKLFILIFGVVFVFLVNGTVEIGFVNQKIEAFKARGVPADISDGIPENHYFLVEPIHDYEDVSRSVFNVEDRLIGSKTDIVVTNRNPMRDNKNIGWATGLLARAFYLGHATINADDAGTEMFEVIGNGANASDNEVILAPNDWITYEEWLGEDGVSPMIIGLRVKYTTADQRDQTIAYADAQIGKPYNFSFIFNRNNSYYCTDLVSRSFSSAGININYDYFATTGNDLIASRQVYVIFVRETVVVAGIKQYNIYFLSNGE
ncbi:MAG TPA: hypothetical protein DD618_03905 [Acholeplasmatales bacterium]|nr:hypothetical protein [Acholeplasmatales bacterium]